MRKRAELFEPGDGGATEQFSNDPLTDGAPPGLTRNDQRAHFRDCMTERSQLGAPYDLLVANCHDKPIDSRQHFFDVPRKQMAFGKMVVDELANRAGVVRGRGADLDR